MSKWVKTKDEEDHCMECAEYGKGKCRFHCGSNGEHFAEFGYFKRTKTAIKQKPKRAGKYERLLKAILANMDIINHGEGLRMLRTNSPKGYIQGITDKQESELITIKEHMEKKGGAK